ncbi:MAG TPA: putative LPS assembly protein LptD [Balneolaceae bacterium]|nr:putative LPS assembly protein LptD [Balneolaceae bacterium]
MYESCSLNYYIFLLLVFSIMLTRPGTLHAQVVSDTLQTTPPDTLPEQIQPELPAAPADTLPTPAEPGLNGTAADTIPEQLQPDTIGGMPMEQSPQSMEAGRQDIPDAVHFQARDSLTFTLGEQRIAKLFGSSNVRHQSGELSSGIIELDLDKSEVHASTPSLQDTLSYPVLKRDNEDIRSRKISFNYETEKGRFEVAELDIDDGHLIGTRVKNVSRSEVFIEDGIYSTCPPDHMYYYIQAQRMKVVDEEEIFFTNARLYILDIPYPLVFPFGYVPTGGIERRRSGLLEPTYMFQNTSERGLGLQNLGWFQYINDHLTAQTSFDVFTSGTVFNESRLQYRKTGNFNGNIVLGFSSERGLEPTDPGFTETTTRNISITHDQQISPYSNINANINLRSADYFRRNSYDMDERAQTNSTSRMSYRYSHPEGDFNLSVSANLNQQFNTNTTRLSGPDMNFSLRQLTPFKSSGSSSANERFYERITFSYNNNFRSNYNFAPTDRDSADVNWFEALLNPSKHREATGDDRHLQFGFVQRAQLSASQLIPSQFINVSAGASYNEYWYPTSVRKKFNEEENRVDTRVEQGFVTARDFSTNLSFNTTFYGVSQLKIGNFEGLRHTVRPNISFSYSPDFSSDMWGFYREVQRDTLGNTQTYSIFEGEIFGGPSAGEQQTMSFGVTNIFETKRVRRDSTGEVNSENLRLIDNLSATSNYNFAADSLNFGPLNITLSSRVVDGLRLSANASYSFYDTNENGTQINKFIWEDTNKFLRPLNFRMSLSTNISQGSRGLRVSTPTYNPYDPYNQAFFGPVDSRFFSSPVQDFSSPFEMGLDFSYRITFRPGQPANKTAILNANNIRFNLTPKWSVTTRMGYDFIEKELTPSQFSLRRSMVCWDLSFQFSPFGDFQYYSFRLSLTGGQIQSLFQKLPGLNNLERSSSPTGRRPPSSF